MNTRRTTRNADEAERPRVAARPGRERVGRAAARDLDGCGGGAHRALSGRSARSRRRLGAAGGAGGLADGLVGGLRAARSAASSSGIARVRLQVVRGAQQRRLVGVGRVDLGDHPAAEDHDRPVADELDLLQLRGVEQDRGAGLRQVAEQHVDLVLGADVDAAGRVEAEHRPHAAGDPARDRHLLLVAAGEPPHLAPGPGVDLQRRDGAVDLRPLAAEVDQAPAADARREREGDVLADRALHQQGLGAVGRDVDEAGPDRVGRMVERDGRAVHEQLAAARALGAGEDVEQLVLALALERDDPEHLARVQVERDVVQLRAVR